jgi:hypothetical protein
MRYLAHILFVYRINLLHGKPLIQAAFFLCGFELTYCTTVLYKISRCIVYRLYYLTCDDCLKIKPNCSFKNRTHFSCIILEYLRI